MARTPRKPRKTTRAASDRRIPDIPVDEPRVAAINEEPARELRFDTDERSARIGDPVDPEALRRVLPKRREREAGFTGGEIPGKPGAHVTADDLSPETLFDEEGSGNAASYTHADAADVVMRVVDESAIGEGGGLDEAELADLDPIDESELQQQQRRLRRSGGGLANFEPNESGAGSPGREQARVHRGGQP